MLAPERHLGLPPHFTDMVSKTHQSIKLQGFSMSVIMNYLLAAAPMHKFTDLLLGLLAGLTATFELIIPLIKQLLIISMGMTISIS